MRTVLSYFGIGTEYLLERGADRDAYRNGAANDQIVRDPSAIHYLDAWDVAIIRGGPAGLLHKTPDVALKMRSVFMRVDPPSDH